MSNVHIVVEPTPQCLWRLREHDASRCLAPNNWLECVSGHKDHRNCVTVQPGEWNKVTRLYRDAVYARILGLPSPPDMKFQLTAIGKGSLNPATVNDTQLEQEILRKPFLEIFETSDGWIQTSSPISITEANGNSTTVVGLPGNPNPTTTHISVASITGMQIGTRIRIQTPSSYKYRTILNIAGLELEVDDLGEVPLVGATVDTVWGELALFMGALANPFVANSGSMVNRVVLATGYYKSSAIAVSIEAKFRENLGA